MKRIAELRQARGWTQRELAEKMGLYASAISKYELGTAEPNTASLIKFSQVFDVSIDYLIENTDDPTRYTNTSKVVKYIYKLGSDGSSEKIEIDGKELSRLAHLLRAYAAPLLGKEEPDGK